MEVSLPYAMRRLIESGEVNFRGALVEDKGTFFKATRLVRDIGPKVTLNT